MRYIKEILKNNRIWLEQILNGDLNEIIDSLIAADQAAKLSHQAIKLLDRESAGCHVCQSVWPDRDDGYLYLLCGKQKVP